MSLVKPIPDGYHSVQPYLMFKNCDKAIGFYIKAFGARERFRMPDAHGRITHAEIEVGDSTIMMADESSQIDALSVEHYSGSPVSLLLYTEDCDTLL
jgi:PhnB protein